MARLNRALVAAGDDEDEQAKVDWLLGAEGDGELRRHQLLLSLFNAGELCPDGACPECGQQVSSVWSLEAAVSGKAGGDMEHLLALPQASGTLSRTTLVPAGQQELLVPIAVSQTSTVWVAPENNQG